MLDPLLLLSYQHLKSRERIVGANTARCLTQRRHLVWFAEWKTNIHKIVDSKTTVKWSISCHISKQGCRSQQQFQAPSVNFWALRAPKRENNASDPASAAPPCGEQRTKDVKNQKAGCLSQIAVMRVRRISVSPAFFILPYIEKCQIPWDT